MSRGRLAGGGSSGEDRLRRLLTHRAVLHQRHELRQPLGSHREGAARVVAREHRRPAPNQPRPSAPRPPTDGLLEVVRHRARRRVSSCAWYAESPIGLANRARFASGSSGSAGRCSSIRAPLEHQRRQVGIGEVTVVVALFLRAQRPDLAGGRVEESVTCSIRSPRLEHRRSAASRSAVEGALHVGEAVDVLDLGLGAELRRRQPGRTEILASTRSVPFSMLQSLTPAYTRICLQRREVGAGLRRRPQVRFAHDLRERRPRPGSGPPPCDQETGRATTCRHPPRGAAG